MNHYDIIPTHIDNVVAPTTIIHNGEMVTVCGNNIHKGGFCGTTIFGDSYHLGRKLVQVVEFHAERDRRLRASGVLS